MRLRDARLPQGVPTSAALANPCEQLDRGKAARLRRLLEAIDWTT